MLLRNFIKHHLTFPTNVYTLVGAVSLIMPSIVRAKIDGADDPDDIVADKSAYCAANTGSILPACTRCGNCELDQFVQLFVNLSTVMLGLLSAVALLMMVMSGFTIATSAGSPEKLESGKKSMQQTLIGAGLVLVAWLIINTLISILSGESPADGIGKIFKGQIWYKTK